MKWLVLLAVAFAIPVFASPLAPETVTVPAGVFVKGSNSQERERAYRLDEAAYGHSVTRRQGWYDREPQRTLDLDAFAILKTPVTNAQYAAFVGAAGHPAPTVGQGVWKSYGLVHPYSRTLRHQWQNGMPPNRRDEHPVVLVTKTDAETYAAWLSKTTGKAWRLPTEADWGKAARGFDGRTFPWGNDWDPERLNSHDQGPFDTLPVGSFPSGMSPFGALDMAGQVFEWTSSPGNPGRFIVKGGSWDDKGCGVCRPAARHARPEAIKHILIGFRLVHEIAD